MKSVSPGDSVPWIGIFDDEAVLACTFDVGSASGALDETDAIERS